MREQWLSFRAGSGCTDRIGSSLPFTVHTCARVHRAALRSCPRIVHHGVVPARTFTGPQTRMILTFHSVRSRARRPDPPHGVECSSLKQSSRRVLHPHVSIARGTYTVKMTLSLFHGSLRAISVPVSASCSV